MIQKWSKNGSKWSKNSKLMSETTLKYFYKTLSTIRREIRGFESYKTRLKLQILRYLNQESKYEGEIFCHL